MPTLTNNLLRIYELFKKYEDDYVMEVFGRDEEEIVAPSVQKKQS